MTEEKILAILIEYFEDNAWDVHKHDRRVGYFTGASNVNAVLNLDELKDRIYKGNMEEESK